MEDRVIELLLLLGIPPHNKGFRACLYAILMILHDISVMDKITTRLYPEVAKRLSSSGSRVERSIRYAIVKMFDTQDHKRIVDLLGGHETSQKSGMYTNSEFLSLCAIKLRRTLGTEK